MGVSLFLCVACGGSSSGGGSGGGSFSSVVPGDQKLGTISDADDATLCTELKDYLKTSDGQHIVDFECQFAAVLGAALSGANSDADLQQACKSSYDECTAGLASTDAQCTKPAASCNATVFDLEACLNDSSAYYAMLSSSTPSCATVKLSDLSGSGSASTMTPTPPPSCSKYQGQCAGGPMLPSGGSSTPL